MILKDYKLFFICFLIASIAIAQNKISGTITDASSNQPIVNVEVYDKDAGLLTRTNASGFFEFEIEKQNITIVFFSYNYEVVEQAVTGNSTIDVKLVPLAETLSEVEISSREAKVFALKRLKDVEGTAIYAGKKTEVVLVEQSMASLASNNARQIYSQVSGLNIYQNDDAGLQLNIGGRGLDPNRTASFNTRQNGYDISADVLGYPESYYTPAAEGLKEVQIIRGAASLQYGTQFGGLVNFKMKEPNATKPFELITRNTIGSNGLYTNFTSVSGTKDKLSYYSFFNYKKGDGFRDNSNFESKNAFAHIGYQFNEKTKLTGEVTYLRYLAKQAGGLNDSQFEEDPYQSNRARNWFQVDWLLYNLKLSHKFSENTNFTFNAFGLDANRTALGFRNRRTDIEDPGGARDLISSDFNNYGFETRLLSKYNVFNKDATFLIGGKFYKADNSYSQGPGSDGADPNFDSAINEFPFYPTQSAYDNPNLNIAVFGENIFYVTDKFSVTPGARFEFIKTESIGSRQTFNFDGAGNPIDAGVEFQDIENERSFVLLGLGLSYKASKALEFYGNASQNYRSITFGDINIVNPSNAVDPDLDDESGFTLDLGVRGNINQFVSYDANIFGLFYNDRIGLIDATIPPVNNVGKLRVNVGDARIFGVESLIDFNLKKLFNLNNKFSANYFINSSFVTSEYTSTNFDNTSSDVRVGNKVEFIPDVNIKTGLQFGYGNFLSNIQYTYLSSQFTDAGNDPGGDNLNSIVGTIPSYDVLDVSVSYKYKRFKLEAGVNNVLDNAYFTRRATGYPGPGIIPSANRNFYTTLQIKI
ncbi:Fe(3+) dicitrate transport protein [Lacinutrix venerupis]|uniref:TonB-dependent receptor domain-containing protein n=1 Tax=Lacinutrix venerupis TaxID=1486034 RepID=UPI000F24F4FC|nr:TonB-dependent receptor [Lacinutrix venerupis]RLJ64323.1 Fe(3+) dicitrate transport protein [Lacinutrix venerupis]